MCAYVCVCVLSVGNLCSVVLGRRLYKGTFPQRTHTNREESDACMCVTV